MSDSLRPTTLVCPKCKNEVSIDVPRISEIVYTCKCGATIEESLLTGSVSIKRDSSPDTMRSLGSSKPK
jgi:hypothetical protein